MWECPPCGRKHNCIASWRLPKHPACQTATRPRLYPHGRAISAGTRPPDTIARDGAMTEQKPHFLERIATDPQILDGKPTITGTRVPVSLILNLLGHGVTFPEIVEDYPELTDDDIK